MIQSGHLEIRTENKGEQKRYDWYKVSTAKIRKADNTEDALATILKVVVLSFNN